MDLPESIKSEMRVGVPTQIPVLCGHFVSYLLPKVFLR